MAFHYCPRCRAERNFIYRTADKSQVCTCSQCWYVRGGWINSLVGGLLATVVLVIAGTIVLAILHAMLPPI